jgi:signal transduction histidine kinase/ActR/RegA family two-component response regulator
MASRVFGEDNNNSKSEPVLLKQRIKAEQLHMHFQQLPAVIIAPALGAIFTAWVLWGAVNLTYLVIGLTLILSMSCFRLVLYKVYFSTPRDLLSDQRWRRLSILTAFISGLSWGCAAIFLYPPAIAEYKVYMLVLLALIPIAPAPVASLAIYMPTFYAYYIPSITPFIVVLGSQDSRGDSMTAVLLLMMMGATITFANKYSGLLAESINLRLQLVDNKKSLENAALEKTKFLAAASHDLRQPAHALGLFLESLTKQVSDIRGLEVLGLIKQSAETLRVMLNGILDISQLDAYVVEVHKKNFNIGKLMLYLYKEYRPQAMKKDLGFHYVPTSLTVYSDPALIERILRNFISNALKYTNHGKIVIGCRRQDGLVKLQVFDTGLGIPDADQQLIFNEYFQLNNHERNQKKGLGLGLSIIKRLAELLDHKISMHSRPGKGSMFSIQLPIAGNLQIDNADVVDPLSSGAELLKNKLVLVIDDDEAVRKAMEYVMREWGGSALTCETSVEAMQILGQKNITPDLLIIDYHLTNSETAETVIAGIRSIIYKQTPTIIITGDTDPQCIRNAHEAGHMLLHKPLHPDKLKACIFSQLQSSEGIIH